jgi:hypothetical protein
MGKLKTGKRQNQIKRRRTRRVSKRLIKTIRLIKGIRMPKTMRLIKGIKIK